MSNWISVKDSTPSNEKKVLCFGSLTTDLGFSFYTDIAYCCDGQNWSFFNGTISDGWSITHWMPLPEPPEVK